MTGDARPAMPPVQLPSEAELARDALAAPLFSRAVALARWAGERLRVGAGGELLGAQLKEAAGALGLPPDEAGTAAAADAWNLAVDIGLLDVEDDETDADPAAVGDLAEDTPVATATPGEDLQLCGGSGAPADVMELWESGLAVVMADAATPSLEDLLGDLDGAVAEDGTLDPDAVDLDALEWDPEEESAFLETALGHLYLLTASETAAVPAPEGGDAEGMVPLPVLAASMLVPDETDEPTDEMLEEISAAMMRLDEQFRLLEPTGLIAYRPVDEALTREFDGELPEELDDEDVSRYGMVRLTPLGRYGVREQLRESGFDAPAVGDLADRDAAGLLAAVTGYPDGAARAETAQWLAQRDPLEAAGQLLAAARGDDADAPARRLVLQQALAMAGAEAEPALREVLADRELGGLARVWLAERGAADVPAPDEDMVFWLTVDTLAAQLATAGEPEELQALVEGLVEQHAGFFDKVWQVDHPATGDVLDAMGRVHPDRKVAKEARKAAFKARSRRP
jgi:hypothetical protein